MAITYARYMNFRPSGPIPGAFEPRPLHAAAWSTVATTVGVTPNTFDARAPVYDRERLEREREGGGAPSERTGRGHRTMFARVFDFLVR
jgi:hypothetical protein